MEEKTAPKNKDQSRTVPESRRREEMESAGEWLEKALVELCSKIETGLGLGLDEEIIKGLVSYCDLAQPQDAKEYLDVILFYFAKDNHFYFIL